ncbi:MarR family transcriptional regulator [Mucisphaera calidilacus]|uniref:Multiple antibiotic resistance protein MarR n=1 Tax=Mucisphaera calidilacus TaxID=2527982 RepID=A0A518BVT3_9BACT|nr:MarR family transcriptional regulator [Mucisphaera calidilacus]QDU71093.1 Multiple antibiotic resistance protein MarR [Mucisphaera calidilacus]
MFSEQIIEGSIAFALEHTDVDEAVMRDGLSIIALHSAVDHAVETDIQARLGITKGQISVLKVIYHHPAGQVTPAELAEESDLTRSAITGVLDALEKLGHIERMPHPSDRRMILVVLSASGRAFAASCLKKHYQMVFEIMSRLTQRERQTLLSSYAKVLSHTMRGHLSSTED